MAIRTNRSAVAPLFLALWLLTTSACALDAYTMTVTADKIPGGYQLVARNPGAAAMSLRIALTEEVNLRTDRSFPFYAVVPANSPALVLATITPARAQERYAFKFRSRWVPGVYSVEPNTDEAYRLPFENGARFVIGQAPGGRITTHTGDESRYAVDIPMPEGTPIVAARDGVVIETEAGFSEGGQRPELAARANRVRIQHADGTLASYTHLKRDGVRVQVGASVKAGEVIGLSGSTGYSSGPHLHFVVFRQVRTDDDFSQRSIPFQFYLGDPPVLFAPRTGQLLEAQYAAPGKRPSIVAKP